MLIRGNGEWGEVSGDSLDLFFLLATIASRKNIGATNTPPGTMSSSTPMIAGIHHVPRLVWAFWDSLLGIQV